MDNPSAYFGNITQVAMASWIVSLCPQINHSISQKESYILCVEKDGGRIANIKVLGDLSLGAGVGIR